MNEQELVVKDFCAHLGCTERSPAALVTEDMAGNLHVVDADSLTELVAHQHVLVLDLADLEREITLVVEIEQHRFDLQRVAQSVAGFRRERLHRQNRQPVEFPEVRLFGHAYPYQ